MGACVTFYILGWTSFSSMIFIVEATLQKKLVLYAIYFVPRSYLPKDVASIILLKNDFASIPVAIELGRLVFDNLKKVILYLMPVRFPIIIPRICLEQPKLRRPVPTPSS